MVKLNHDVSEKTELQQNALDSEAAKLLVSASVYSDRRHGLRATPWLGDVQLSKRRPLEYHPKIWSRDLLGPLKSWRFGLPGDETESSSEVS